MILTRLIILPLVITYLLFNSYTVGAMEDKVARNDRTDFPVVTANQGGTPDSLNKFSYQVFGSYKGQFTSGGTCFFLKNGDHTVMISNYHVFAGYDPKTKSKLFDLDTLWVFNPDHSADNSGFFSIAFDSSLIEPNIKNQADYLVIEVPWKANFNLINNYFDSTLFDEEPIDFYMYGYPVTVDSQNRRYGFYTDGKYVKDIAPYINSLPLTEEQKKNTIDYRSKYFFLIPGEAKEGMSGAPVFGKFKFIHDGQTKYKFQFMGIFSEQYKNFKMAWALKADIFFSGTN